MIEIYSDGAYSSSRDQGGWAFYIDTTPQVLKYDGLMTTTNNRMEIMGCIKAMEYVRDNNITENITIYTDSMYVIGTMTKNWKMKKNTDLWPIMFKLATPNIRFVHVKGHEGNVGNSLCDKWAVFASHVDGCEIDLHPVGQVQPQSEGAKTGFTFDFN